MVMTPIKTVRAGRFTLFTDQVSVSRPLVLEAPARLFGSPDTTVEARAQSFCG